MTQELEKELIEFYLTPNSAREIERIYGVNLYQLKKLLAKYEIPMHAKSDAYKLRNERTKEVCLERYGTVNPAALPEVKDKIKQTMLDRYGVEYVGQAEISKQKTKEAFLEKYGVDSYTKTKEFKNFITDNKEVIVAKAKATCLKKYGVESVLLIPEVQKKKYETALARYGNGNFTNREKAKATCLERYGTEYYASTKEAVIRCHETKKRNGSYRKSSYEDLFYQRVADLITEKAVIPQYCDKERYPFACDFYIPALDLFVEINAHPTHGGHPFDINSDADQRQLAKWQEKQKTKPFYAAMIDVWTRRDPIKMKTAKENNLNYICLYNKQQINNFAEGLSEILKLIKMRGGRLIR